MFKRDLIKKLHGVGIRYADKQGIGRVKLQHIKTAVLAKMWAEYEANK